MKRLMILLMALSGMLAMSCHKEADPMGGGLVEDGSEAKEDVTATIYIDAVSPISTRAIDSGERGDDRISSLDMYIFDEDGNNLEHYALSEKELSDRKMHIQRRSGVTEYYLFLANIDYDTAEWLAGLKANEFSDSKKGHIPLSAGNFRGKELPMGGSTKVEYKNDTTITVDMYRYQSKIDVGYITAYFDDKELMNRDIFITRIVIVNSFDVMQFMNWNKNTAGMPQMLFGPHHGFTSPAFGALMTGYMPGISSYVNKYSSVTFEGAEGLLSHEKKYMLNCNYEEPENTLIVDAPDFMYDATVHDIPDGEGQLCSSSDPDHIHTIPIHCSFYVMSSALRLDTHDIICTYAEQDYSIKLVIEVMINGEPFYYPIRMDKLQPNTNYRIGDIILKSKGSKYSNFYEKTFEASFPFAIVEWDEINIGNLEVGYKEGNKETY
jgi:hypothetical protein